MNFNVSLSVRHENKRNITPVQTIQFAVLKNNPLFECEIVAKENTHA